MRKINTIMRELLNLFPRYKFGKIVSKYSGNRYTKYYTTWHQLITLLYSQITNKDSLREIIVSLNVHKRNWYHLGFKGVKRSTLSDSMQKRSHKIFEELFYTLLKKCKRVTPKHKFKFKNPLYSIDSTTIDLCLSIFPWAKFRKRKGAIKLHYLYNHSGCLPSFITMTDGKIHDIMVAKKNRRLNFKLLPDSIIAMDKAYIDYKWLYTLEQKGVYFVTRVKNNIDCELLGQHQPIKDDDIERDDIIVLSGAQTKEKYPKKLRVVGFINPDDNKYYEFMTNNFELEAKTIADIYKSRWEIEIFFKWVKQNLKIKSFLGSSQNAVLSQIWVAMCYYLLLRYIKYQTRFAHSLTVLHTMISEVLMARVNLLDILQLKETTIHKARAPDRKIKLF